MNSTSGPSNLVRQHHSSSRLVQQHQNHNISADYDLFDDIPCGTYRLNFGSNFLSNKPDSEFHTVKFDIKPSSVNGNAFLSFDDKDAIKVTIPSEDGSDGHSLYKGTVGSNKNGKECILLLDGENLRIENLTTTSNVKHIRSEGTNDMIDVELLRKQAEAAKPWVPPKIKEDVQAKKPFWMNKQKPTTAVHVPKPVQNIIQNKIVFEAPKRVQTMHSEDDSDSSDDEMLLLKEIERSPVRNMKRELPKDDNVNNMLFEHCSPKRKPEAPTQTILADDLDLSDSSDDSSDDEAMDYTSSTLTTLKKDDRTITEFMSLDDKFSGPLSAASTTSTFSRPMSSASRFSNGSGPSPLLRTPGGSSGPSPSLTRTPGSSGPSPLLRTPGSTSSGPSPSLRPPSTSFSSHSSTSGCSAHSFTSTLTANSVLSTDLHLSESSSSEDEGD